MDTVQFAERTYPTIYDYDDAKRLGSSAIVDEIKGKSNLIFDAAVGTTSGYDFTFDRTIEKKNTASAMAFDEGWTANKDGRTETIGSTTMRVGDARRFDQLAATTTSDNGAAGRILAMQNMASSILRLKGEKILYGGLPDADGNVNPKDIMGLFNYIDRISDYDKMKQVYYEGRFAPFKGENGLTLDNQSGSETSDASAVSAAQGNNVWASVLGVAWGKDGVFTTYPQFMNGKGGAYNMTIRPNNPAGYQDKFDGNTKMMWDDWIVADACFGLGVRNRFAISGIRNIYLGHKKKSDLEDEMYRLQQNLITLKRWFGMGETGLTMRFYTSADVVNSMEMFQKGRVVQMSTTPNGNDGSYGSLNTGRITVADGIELVSDFAFNGAEKFVSKKETWA